MLDRLFPKNPEIASLVMRLGVGSAFTVFGLGKLFGMFGGPGWDATAKNMGRLGLGPGHVLAGLVGGCEALFGICLILGFFTRYAVWPLIVIMLVAIWKVHWSAPLAGQGSMMTNIVYLALLLGIFLNGGGMLSMDRYLARRKAVDEATRRT